MIKFHLKLTTLLPLEFSSGITPQIKSVVRRISTKFILKWSHMRQFEPDSVTVLTKDFNPMEAAVTHLILCQGSVVVIIIIILFLLYSLSVFWCKTQCKPGQQADNIDHVAY